MSMDAIGPDHLGAWEEYVQRRDAEQESNIIRIPCEACQREGRILRASAVNPYEEVDCGPCEACGGTAYVAVEADPITMTECAENG